MTNEADIMDAQRWNALLASDRIRIMSSKGFANRQVSCRPPDYKYLCVELWSLHNPPVGSANARDRLTAYSDTLILRNAGTGCALFNAAARWRAMLSSPRFKVTHTAGFNDASGSNHYRYLIIAMRTDTLFKKADPTYGRTILTQYADAILQIK